MVCHYNNKAKLIFKFISCHFKIWIHLLIILSKYNTYSSLGEIDNKNKIFYLFSKTDEV